jgi:hypothetical protein
MDAAGVDMLLHCMAEIMKRDGELKLAAVSPQASVVLELTRTDRLFEVFETSGDAVRSFYRFLPNAMKNQPMLVPKMEKPEKATPIPINGDTAGGDRAPMAA